MPQTTSPLNALADKLGEVQLRIFLERHLPTLQTEFSQLQMALDTQRFDLITFHAHQLKSITHTLGYTELGQLLEKIESSPTQYTTTHRLNPLQTLVDKLLNDMKQAIATL